MNNHNLRTMVRGAYDIQKLRIQMGNRICMNFKAKLGQASSIPEEEMDEEAKKMLKDLRVRYRKMTDGITNFLGGIDPLDVEEADHA